MVIFYVVLPILQMVVSESNIWSCKRDTRWRMNESQHFQFSLVRDAPPPPPI